VRMISLDDLIANKNQLKRSGEKGMIDQYDLEVLRKIKDRRAQP
jgi:hypothetical protein